MHYTCFRNSLMILLKHNPGHLFSAFNWTYSHLFSASCFTNDTLLESTEVFGGLFTDRLETHTAATKHRHRRVTFAKEIWDLQWGVDKKKFQPLRMDIPGRGRKRGWGGSAFAKIPLLLCE